MTQSICMHMKQILIVPVWLPPLSELARAPPEVGSFIIQVVVVVVVELTSCRLREEAQCNRLSVCLSSERASALFSCSFARSRFNCARFSLCLAASEFLRVAQVKRLEKARTKARALQLLLLTHQQLASSINEQVERAQAGAHTHTQAQKLAACCALEQDALNGPSCTD